jgi:hypothetical protein
MPNRLTGLFVLIAALMGAPLPAWSQAGRSGISGTIFDAAKAVLPGVTVTITNEDTGLTRTVVTDDEGRYIIPTVTPGTYTLAAELPGFQSLKRPGVRLAVGQELDLDMTMNVATIEEQVTVTAQASVVEATSSRVGTNVTTREIDNLPSTGRNQLALMQLVPGLTPSLNPGSFEGGQFNANGRETGSNLFMVDGVYNNDDRLGGSQGTQARIPLDVMAEYQVLTHQYTAEFGGSSGVVVNAVTKSGTNTLNGRAYFYGQDESLNQTDHFLELEGEENPPASTQNWGGNAGGPIVRNKAFWFASIERSAIDLGVSLIYPPEAAPLAVSYTDTATIRAWNTFLRGDYQMTSNNHLSVRWVKESAITFGEDWEEDLSTPENIAIENDGNDAQYSASWTSVIGNRATNELKFGHVREDLLQGGRPYFDADNNFIELNGRDQFDIGSMNEHPDFGAGPLDLHGSAKVRTWAINNDFTFLASGAGDHTLKAGIGWSQNGSQPQIVGSGDNGAFEFLHNRPFNPADPFTYPSVFSIRLGEIYFDLTDQRVNWYLQDKWQVNNNLTLNLGVRYDYQELVPNTKNAIAPRLGFAYDPTGSGKTVIRGGVGKFYEYQLNTVQSDLARAGVISPAFVYETEEDEGPLDGEVPSDVCLQATGSGGLALISPSCRAFLEGVRAEVEAGGFINSEPIFDGDRRLGYLWSFSFGVQRELVPNLGLTVDYVGNRGRDQTALIDINEPRLLADGTFGRPGPAVFDPDGTLVPARARATEFGRVLQYQTREDLNSDYNALEIGIDKRYSGGWSSRVSYTLARARDVGFGNISTKRFTDDLNPRGDYGLASFDNRHALAASFNANPWRGLGAGAVFRYYSGYPINETVGSDVNGDRDNNDRPVAGVHDATSPIVSPLDENGRAIRNGIDGENQVILDLRLQYIFDLPAQNSLGLFWEIFNATGRVNFGNPTGNRRSSNFLVPVSAGNMRSMQLGVRYSF